MPKKLTPIEEIIANPDRPQRVSPTENGQGKNATKPPPQPAPKEKR